MTLVTVVCCCNLLLTPQSQRSLQATDCRVSSTAEGSAWILMQTSGLVGNTMHIPIQTKHRSLHEHLSFLNLFQPSSTISLVKRIPFFVKLEHCSLFTTVLTSMGSFVVCLLLNLEKTFLKIPKHLVLLMMLSPHILNDYYSYM